MRSRLRLGAAGVIAALAVPAVDGDTLLVGAGTTGSFTNPKVVLIAHSLS